eukprot:gb/GEZN01005813.1/.p1 GENE.gb/GEZN01005813.1/~~gb/GEZN01005813.1/.p1  ORF type:complete len:530 (+),score=47.48 gb/GEZN01005813.1/:33-1622(+)
MPIKSTPVLLGATLNMLVCLVIWGTNARMAITAWRPGLERLGGAIERSIRVRVMAHTLCSILACLLLLWLSSLRDSFYFSHASASYRELPWQLHVVFALYMGTFCVRVFLIADVGSIFTLLLVRAVAPERSDACRWQAYSVAISSLGAVLFSLYIALVMHGLEWLNNVLVLVHKSYMCLLVLVGWFSYYHIGAPQLADEAVQARFIHHCRRLRNYLLIWSVALLASFAIRTDPIDFLAKFLAVWEPQTDIITLAIGNLALLGFTYMLVVNQRAALAMGEQAPQKNRKKKQKTKKCTGVAQAPKLLNQDIAVFNVLSVLPQEEEQRAGKGQTYPQPQSGAMPDLPMRERCFDLPENVADSPPPDADMPVHESDRPSISPAGQDFPFENDVSGFPLSRDPDRRDSKTSTPLSPDRDVMPQKMFSHLNPGIQACLEDWKRCDIRSTGMQGRVVGVDDQDSKRLMVRQIVSQSMSSSSSVEFFVPQSADLSSWTPKDNPTSEDSPMQTKAEQSLNRGLVAPADELEPAGTGSQ